MNISKNIATTITQYLKETIKRDEEREVLLVDEYGKEIVYDNGDYRIVVDDEDNARYITLWHKKYVKGNGKWTKCGVLDANRTTVNNDDMKGNYLSIGSVEIDKKHRGKGFGTKMYKALFDFSSNDIKGILSYLPNRSNKKQIPRIYSKLGAITKGDYQYIDFNN
jgi:GNAT superfamily N-acetyltransferase